jgi:hypothetical protein
MREADEPSFEGSRYPAGVMVASGPLQKLRHADPFRGTSVEEDTLAARLGSRFALATMAAVLAVGLAAPAANADLLGNLIGNNCPTKGSQVFAPWNDYLSYYLAPNGGLENGSTGWSLSGASVVSGNQPFFASGTHSLSLPSGSRAVSPTTCIGPYALTLRMFGSDVGGTDKGVRVRVLWYGLLNRLLGTTDYNTFPAGGKWAPTSSVKSSGGFNLLLPLLGSTSARIEITPLGTGSAWRIDDVYVDPWASRD